MTGENITDTGPWAAKALPEGGFEYRCVVVQDVDDEAFLARFESENGALCEVKLDKEDLGPEDLARLDLGAIFLWRVIPKDLPDPCAVMDRIDGDIEVREVDSAIEFLTKEPITQTDIDEALARARARRAALGWDELPEPEPAN